MITVETEPTKSARVGLLAVPALASLFATALVWITWQTQFPLGVIGEWTWHRSARLPGVDRYIVPALAFAGYVAVVLLGLRVLRQHPEGWICVLLPALVVAGALVQLAEFDLPPSPAGLERWPLSLGHEASSGYLSHARRITDARRFLADFERWIARQDHFHIGTHPPGLFLLYRAWLDYFAGHPQSARFLVRAMPLRFRQGLAELRPEAGLGLGEQAAIAALASLTWLAGLATLVPLYSLVRLEASPATAWLSASLWPVVPAVPLFLPVSDCLYPVLAVTTVLLLLWSVERQLAILAVLAGLVFWCGMFTSLAFLAVLPIALGSLTMYFLRLPAISVKRWLLSLAAFAAGVALPTELCWNAGALHLNLPVVWSINLDKHAGFYLDQPRTYWLWVGINLLEFAVVSGPAVFALAVTALFQRPWRSRLTGATAVHLCWLATVVALDLSGRNLGEVGRLWIFLTPFACLGAARALGRRQPDAALAIVWLAGQALVGWALIATVEPLLPIGMP